MIKDMLKDYLEITSQIEELESKKNELRGLVLNELGNMGVEKYADEDYSATLSYKDTFKYSDETAIINWLKNNGYENFVIEKVDTKLNKELKSGTKALTEGLNGLYVHNTSTALTVKKV